MLQPTACIYVYAFAHGEGVWLISRKLHIIQDLVLLNVADLRQVLPVLAIVAPVWHALFRTNPCYRLQQAILRISLNLLAACGRV